MRCGLIPGSGRSLGEEDPLGKEMATHSSILAWEIPWTEEPGGLQSMKSQKCHARHSDKQQPQAMPCVKWWEYISFFFFLFGNTFQSCSVVSDSLWPHGLYSQRNSPGQNTGMGSLSLLQGIFPTQGSNSSLLHFRQILYQLNHKEAWGYMGDYIKSSFLKYSCPFNNIDFNNTDSLYVDFFFNT